MEKLTKLRKILKENNLDAILITNSFNRRYITGFTGSAGVALITNNDARFITDFRYIEQANEQAKEFTIIEHKKVIIDEVNKQLKDLQVTNVGFEKEHISFAVYEQYKKVMDAELIPVSNIVEQLRLIKTTEELNILKEAAEIADAAFEHIKTFIKPGVKEIDVSNELEFFMRKQGATSSSFDTIVASGYRAALPHGVATEKEIMNGELVTLDYGALYKGYCSDITRTLAVGEINKELKEIYLTVQHAQELGVKGIKPGITGKEADDLTRSYITDKGYGSYFGHSTGHGIGLEVHEGPRLAQSSDTVLKPGMVVTVEPGIYVPGVGGCRIEDDIIVTESGYKLLTFASKDLVQL